MSSFATLALSLEGVDVQDFPLETDVGSSSLSSSSGVYRHLYGLMQMANEAFRENRLDQTLQSIQFYSNANLIEPDNSIILSNRCAAHLRVSHFYKHRPSFESEDLPVSGLDPMINACYALKDAEKVTSLQSNSITSYILKANALILLERYEHARDVIYSGLQVDPISSPLMNLKRSIDNIFSGGIQVKPQLADDYECPVCMKIMYEPVTTPCGHSFCRSCLFQTLDRGNRCPLCRTVMHNSHSTCAISVTLKNVIQKNFPEEYTERKMENDILANPGVDLLPLFIIDVVFPYQQIWLNIFEPRYRLMVRRLMEGNRRMGVTMIDPTTGLLVDHACEVEIKSIEPHAKCSLFIEVESRRRCRIIRGWDQDGYRVVEVEWIEDRHPSEETERNELLEITQRAADFAHQYVRDAKEAMREDKENLARTFRAEALMPATSDPERFSFWLAALTNRTPLDKLELLRVRDTRERIIRSMDYMKAVLYGS